MDWTLLATRDAESERARIARELLESNAYAGMASRVAEFIRRGGVCRATFFDYRTRLAKVG
jgi:hypothetical protein